MKMTVVTGADGTIVAAQYGHAPRPDTTVVTNLNDWRAGLYAGPGQKIHSLDVHDSLLNVTSPAELETQLKAVLNKSH